MKVIQVWLRVFALFMVFLFSSVSLQAEGSWQMGLKEGSSHNQPLFEWNSQEHSTATGLEIKERPLYVDILNTNEIINIHVCGKQNSNRLKIEIYNESGTSRLYQKTLDYSNVSCTDRFQNTLSGGVDFKPGVIGTYQIHLGVLHDSEGEFHRFDVFVKADQNTAVDPTLDQGRLWGYRLAFDAGRYEESHSTSANLYAVVDGGFVNSYYVWELDLNKFAGYRYELVANDLGLTSPNSDGTVVAGLSGCIDSDHHAPCPEPRGNRNNVDALYKIYFSDPQTQYPRPSTKPEISNLEFIDDDGVDDSISPSNHDGVQDTGYFTFITNLATRGTYTITLDIDDDGKIGPGDVFLTGAASPGKINRVQWNGKANDGSSIPPGSYRAQTVLKTGEFHFTAADVETSGGHDHGLTINAVLDNGQVDRSNKVYWNDETYLKLTHTDSYNGDGAHKYHTWGSFGANSDGNRAYVDTYTYGEASASVFVTLAVETTDTPRTKITGCVFKDLNSNGIRDAGEPGFENITVRFTGSSQYFYASTQKDGTYTAHTDQTGITVDVNESMLPPGYFQTAGTDPETFTLHQGDNDVGCDGYAFGKPAMTIEKSASPDQNVKVGDIVTYTYVVTNTGNVDINNVTIADVHSGLGTVPLPGGETLINTSGKSSDASADGSIDRLAPGDVATFTATYTVIQGDIDAVRPIINTATANGTPSIGTLTPPTDQASVTPALGIPVLTIEKRASKTSNVVAGDIITYTYVVKNKGNVAISNVNVTDVHSGTGTLSSITPATVANLAPGYAATFTATYTVTQDDIDAGAAIRNTATAHGTPATGTLVPPIDQVLITPTAPSPSMNITKSADKKSNVIAGETVTYTYVITNTGNVDIHDVNITDIHSGTGIAPVPGSEILTNTSGNSSDAAIDGKIDTLAPGDVATFTATYVVTLRDIEASRVISNIATAHGTPSGPVPLVPPAAQEIVTPVPTAPAMTITKNANKTTGVVAGDTIKYTYVVTNTGNVDIGDVNITDLHSGTGIAPVPGNENLTNTSGLSSDATPNDGIIDTLAPGDMATFTSEYNVTQGDIDAGTAILNIATANGIPAGPVPLLPPSAQETVIPVGAVPAMTIKKSADKKINVNVGDKVTYTYVVTNTGNVDISNVNVTDIHGGTGTLSAITPANVATLAPGNTATFTSTYVVTQGDIDAAKPILNTATANSTTGSVPIIPPTAWEVITPIVPAPSMTIKKTADKTKDVLVGDTITYTYEVTNTGNVDISNVNVTDVHSGTGTLSAITPANVAILAPGDVATFTATYDVTQADFYAGKAILNIATAHGTPAGPVPLLPPTANETVIPVGSTPAMTIKKTADRKSNVAVGDTITYTYVVTNTGNVDISNVNITDVHTGTGTLSAITPSNVAILAPGDVATFTATYDVTQGDIDAGQSIINTATAHGTAAGSVPLLPPKAQLRVTPGLGIPAMTIEKSTNKKSGFKAGDTIIYTYVVTNTGNVDIDHVTIDDVHKGTGTAPVPGNENLTNSSGLSSDATPNDGIIDTLAPGDVATFTSGYIVTHDDIDAGIGISNIATANGTPRIGILTPPKDKKIVTLEPQKPEIALVKTASVGGTGAVGDIITYAFAVTNTGNVVLNDISVSDLLPGLVLLGNPIASLDPGVTDSTSITGSYTITDKDAVNGSIINQATATGVTTTGILVTDRSNNNFTTGDKPTVTPVLPPVVPPVAIPTALGDLVWYDNNHDGIQNLNENGVNGVKVYLLDGYGARMQQNGADVFRETNSTGEYIFDMLIPNEYYAVEFDINTLPVRYE